MLSDVISSAVEKSPFILQGTVILVDTDGNAFLEQTQPALDPFGTLQNQPVDNEAYGKVCGEATERTSQS